MQEPPPQIRDIMQPHKPRPNGPIPPSCVTRKNKPARADTRPCAACVGRPVKVAVVATKGLAKTLPAEALRAQARCWKWHFITGDSRALERIRSVSPHVLVLSTNLPAACGLPPARQLQAHVPGLRVVVVAQHAPANAVILHSLLGGAFGCLVEPVSPAQVARAVAGLADRLPALCPKAQAVVLQFLHDLGAAPRPKLLTPREYEIMLCVEQGLSHKDIASALNLKETTLHAHFTSIFKKLGVHDTHSALREFVRLRASAGGGAGWQPATETPSSPAAHNLRPES